MSGNKPPRSAWLRLVVNNRFVVVGEKKDAPELTLLPGEKEDIPPAPAPATLLALPSPAVRQCADRLVAAYHQEQLNQKELNQIPGLCLRIQLEPGFAPDILEAAAIELERRGWTVTSADFPERDIARAKALWLRPYA